MKKLSILLLLLFLLSNMVTAADPTFLQPLLCSARISYFFNAQPKPFSNGIFWSVPIGTQVVAAADGTVVKSEWMAGLGSILLIKHSDNHTTVYGHLSKIIANPDSVVKQGDVIGLSGDTGYALEPGLYFEIQKGDVSQDPSGYLNLGYSQMPYEASANTKHYPNQPLGWSDWIWSTPLSDIASCLSHFTGLPEDKPLVDFFNRNDETDIYLQTKWDPIMYCFINDLFTGVILVDDAVDATSADSALSMQYGEHTREVVTADASVKSWEGNFATIVRFYIAADDISPSGSMVYIGTNAFIETMFNLHFGMTLDELYLMLAAL